MFERAVGLPTAVASDDDEGVAAAIAWCCEHLEDGDTLHVWTHLKSNLSNCPALERLVRTHSNVEHIVRRGGGSPHSPGPLLMAWADMDDIADVMRFGSGRVRALGVITWSEEALRPWVSVVNPVILGDASPWAQRTPALHPVVIEALASLTRSINHNNTLAGGYEKDDVVSTLLALRDASVPMRPEAMEGWALAHGWTGNNPRLLAKYVADINDGKRPRSRQVLRSDFVAHLRGRLQALGHGDP